MYKALIHASMYKGKPKTTQKETLILRIASFRKNLTCFQHVTLKYTPKIDCDVFYNAMHLLAHVITGTKQDDQQSKMISKPLTLSIRLQIIMTVLYIKTCILGYSDQYNLLM